MSSVMSRILGCRELFSVLAFDCNCIMQDFLEKFHKCEFTVDDPGYLVCMINQLNPFSMAN